MKTNVGVMVTGQDVWFYKPSGSGVINKNWNKKEKEKRGV